MEGSYSLNPATPTSPFSWQPSRDTAAHEPTIDISSEQWVRVTPAPATTAADDVTEDEEAKKQTKVDQRTRKPIRRRKYSKRKLPSLSYLQKRMGHSAVLEENVGFGFGEWNSPVVDRLLEVFRQDPYHG